MTPYYSTPDGRAKLYLGDARQLSAIDNESIDLVVTDPPFGVESLDYPSFFAECRRVMKEGAAIYCYWSSKGIAYLEPLFREAFDLHNIIAIRTKNFICHPWDKTAFDFKWTPVFFGAKGKLDYRIAERCFAEGYDTGDAWDCVMPQSNWVKEKRVHRYQKPEESIERMVRISSVPDDCILDPCVGSGTTCAVAYRLGRKTIGIDLKEECLNMAKNRLLQGVLL